MKLPRDLSGEEVCRALRRMGFSEIRQTGSHRRLARGADRATVPMHRALRVGTLQSVLKQAGITLEDLLENL